MSIKTFLVSYFEFSRPSVLEPAHTTKDKVKFIAEYTNKQTRNGLKPMSKDSWGTLYSMPLTEKQLLNLSIHKCTTYRDIYDCTGINLIPKHFKPNKPPKYK